MKAGALPVGLGDLRVLGRSLGFAGWTYGFVSAMEVHLLLAGGGRDREIIQRWMARYGRGLLDIYGLDVRAAGPHIGAGHVYPGQSARGRGRVFVMNHRSMLDIFVSLAHLDGTIVSRNDLERWPVIGLAARRVGVLFVDRQSKQSGAAVINAMTRGLEAGRGVLVYPEGTTFSGDEVRPFRNGAFLAAQRAGAEIVPLGIAYGGGSAAFVEESFPAHYRRISSAPKTRVALSAGEPIVPREGEALDALRDRTHEAVQALVRSARARIADAG